MILVNNGKRSDAEDDKMAKTKKLGTIISMKDVAVLGTEVLVNGRHLDWHDGVEKIEQTNSYTHEITFQGKIFRVWGGQQAGGDRRMWFTEWVEVDEFTGEERECQIESNSARAATKLIWNM